jgi:uncharacterized repeat protein (TIGR03803 family)
VIIIAANMVGHAQNFNVLFNFNEQAYQPIFVSLIQGPDGNYYGTTGEGPENCHWAGTGCGTVFKVDHNGVMTILHQFCSKTRCVDGAQPDPGLLLGHDGNFYGTTVGGGSFGAGTIFKITSQGTLTTLYSFCAQKQCSDGAEPAASLLEGLDGNLYGTTSAGGNASAPGGCGTIFHINPKGTLATLHIFTGVGGDDGCGPLGNLIQASDGNYYGTTEGGGSGFGTVYKMTAKGLVTILHSFCSSNPPCPDGFSPFAGLVQASDGELYGTAEGGGSGNEGTIFRITRTGVLSTLHSFCMSKGCLDGQHPLGGLIQATDGNLYGTTSNTGTAYGTVFRLNTAGKFGVLHTFIGSDGAYPEASLLQGTNGIFYGTTFGGGPGPSFGTVFTLDMGLGPFVAFVRRTGRVGQTGGILGQGFTGATAVLFNGAPANFTVSSDTFITATVPQGATSGYVTVTTPNGVLQSNVPFRVIP